MKSPKIIPRLTGLKSADKMSRSAIVTPAFANAKTGIMKNTTQG